jgi:SAM-dependent methyltransferase
MAQNIYDDAAFFEGYSKLGRSREGLAGAGEWPAVRALLPDLAGRAVVDLGCGFGWFSLWAREHGAARVLGLDVSENMLARARAAGDDPAISYVRADLEELDLPPAAFDLAYSSLALHYIRDLGRLLAVVHQALVPGGSLVCTIEHPIYMAPSHPGWVTGPDGRKTWPVDGYQMEGPRTTDWLAKGVVKYHRTLGSTLNLLIRAGFSIAHVEEWAPTDAQVQAHPEWAIERERPMFLLIVARRRSATDAAAFD